MKRISIIKAITSITCGLGLLATIPYISTSCKKSSGLSIKNEDGSKVSKNIEINTDTTQEIKLKVELATKFAGSTIQWDVLDCPKQGRVLFKQDYSLDTTKADLIIKDFFAAGSYKFSIKAKVVGNESAYTTLSFSLKVNEELGKIIPNDWFTYSDNNTKITGVSDKWNTEADPLKNYDTLLIPETVTEIADNAFYSNGSGKITNCSIRIRFAANSQLDSIGQNAFYNCIGLNGRVYFPANLRTLGSGSFHSCGGIDALNFSKCEKLETIDNETFSFCSELSSLELPPNLIKIGESAFGDCLNLISLDLPSKLQEIGKFAFIDCIKISNKLTIPDTLNKVGNSAFYNCPGISELTNKDKQKIGDSYYIARLGGVGCLITSTTASWDGTFDDNTTIVGHISFGNNLDMSSLAITKINANLFDDCTSIAGNLTLPETLISIGDYAFEDCYEFSSVNLPANLTNVGKCAFKNCSKITSLALPSKLTTIGDQAFYNCSSVTGTLELPTTLTSVGQEAFYKCQFGELKNKHGQLGSGPYYIVQLNHVKCLLTTSTFTNTSVPVGSIAYGFDLNLPQDLTAVANNAFTGSPIWGVIIFPASVTTIGNDSFQGCNKITQMTLPASLTTIGSSAFRGCTGLFATLDLPSTLTSVGTGAFEDCSGYGQIKGNFSSSPTWSGSNIFKGWDKNGGWVENNGSLTSGGFLTYLKSKGLPTTWTTL